MSCPHSATDGACALCAAGATQPPDDATLRREGDSPAASGLSDGVDFGTRVDRYVVHDLIGRGGMGMVYTAHDPDLDRWVAIKLLRASVAAPGDSLSLGQARLLREAQAMAQLSHPNVVPVYDVGTHAKSVFIAMELVRGLTLDKWVAARARPWREVLSVFLQAGAGLAAAHAAGLVHRDFKPANVLMGEDGRPRVTDFGIARSLKTPDAPLPEGSRPPSSSSSLDTPLTRAGALMGSPGYMAPEQYAGLPTSPATDQFAFCVALYEALYGSRPFQGATFNELAHATTLGRVPPPPKGTAVPPWLFRILETGLSPEAGQRHPSMAVLLSKLSHDPDAQRRRRLTWAAGVLVAGAAVAAAGWSQYQQRRACRGADALLTGAWDGELRAKGKAAFEASGKSYAALAWERATGELDGYAAAWTLARTEACEATRVRKEQSEAVMLLRLRCLDRRRDELAALAGAYAQADVEVVDRAYGAASSLSPVEACAHARLDRMQPPPESQEAVERMGQQLAQGRALLSAGKVVAARELISAAAMTAATLKLPAQQADAQLTLGDLEREARRFPEARAAFERAMQLAEAAGDDETSARALTAMVSVVGWRLEKPGEGRALAAVAQGKIDRIGQDARLQAALDEAIGDSEWQAGERLASLESYRAALNLLVSQQGEESTDVARLRSAIGWVLTERGDFTAASAELERSKAVREKLFGADHPALVSSWNELSTLQSARGEYRRSSESVARAVAIARQALGDESTSVARMELNLVVMLTRDGRVGETAEHLQRAAHVIDTHPELPPSYRAGVLRARCLTESALARWESAQRLCERNLELTASAFGNDHPDAALAALDLARVLTERKQSAEALALYERYLATIKKLGLQGDPDVAVATGESSTPLLQLGRTAEGLARLEESVARFPIEQGNAPRGAKLRFLLAQALGKGERARARTLADEARGLWETAGREEEVARINDWLAAHPASR